MLQSWMPRLISVALYGTLVLSLIADANATPTDTPLIFGVFPNMTAKQTLEIYEPLARLMEKRLQRRVAIYSARDFKTFVERTRQGDYDILLTAPHLAWLARQDAGYRPLLKYARPTRGLLVVKNTSPYRVPEDLRGQSIATPDSIAVATLAVQADMAAHGLRRNVDYQVTDYGSHLNAVMQVINGRTAAAMMGLHPFMLLPADLRRQLRVLIETAPLSSLMYLTHPRLRDREANAIRRALLDFAATPEGKSFMQHGGYGGFVAVDGSELRAFRPYALQAEEMIRAKQ
ncbi:MAG: phosphate/phosphite/phosphonate ABC transporter substrate-binding protein [Hydrogenophilales bacterium]|nr:phosphate/phosphite/phosphonate ABC transporter substrate-binding protein [Hydrogenophilales bacterium]